MKKYNKGQSTIEFIMTFSAAVGFIFLFLKMALNYTNGFMVHHATYMASRAYLVGDAERYGAPGSGDPYAFELAKSVFKKNLPEALIPRFDGELMENSFERTKPFSVFVGVWTEFTQFFSAGFIGGREAIKFRSESLLGREPTRSDSTLQTCLAVKNVITGSGSSGDSNQCEVFQATLDDNGG